MSIRYDYRANPYRAQATATADLVTVPTRYTPLLLWAIERQKDRVDWVTEGDWSQGYTDLCALQWELLMGSRIDELLESNRQIYRLLDTVMNGTSYSATPDPARPGQFVVSPAIPPAPPLAITSPSLGQDPGLRRQLLDAQGIINAGWFGIGGQKATLADVVEALRIGSTQDVERIDSVLEVLSGASSGAVIFGAIRELFTDTAELGTEAATLGTLIAASLANAATQGVISGQLDKLLVALTGFVSGDTNGNPLIPTMIWEAQNTRLRIQQDAETLANKLTAILTKLDNLNLNNDELTPYIDEVEGLLTDIRTMLQ